MDFCYLLLYHIPIASKREDTSLSTIEMSALVTNIFRTFKLAVKKFENEKSNSLKALWFRHLCWSILEKSGLLAKH